MNLNVKPNYNYQIKLKYIRSLNLIGVFFDELKGKKTFMDTNFKKEGNGIKYVVFKDLLIIYM